MQIIIATQSSYNKSLSAAKIFNSGKPLTVKFVIDQKRLQGPFDNMLFSVAPSLMQWPQEALALDFLKTFFPVAVLSYFPTATVHYTLCLGTWT